jgi:hypothetical protein
VLRKHRAGVQAGVHPHDRDSGLAISGEKRALNRRRPAPAGQQRCVNVECAERGNLEHARRKYEAVRRDDKRIGSRSGEPSEYGLVLQRRRLIERETPAGGKLFHGTRRRPPSAAGGTIRLRQDQSDFVAGVQQRRQGERREFGSAGED